MTGPIPPELGSLGNLTSLYLYSNQLSDEIPSSFVNLINLIPFFANIGYNMLTAPGAVATFFDDKDSDWADTQTVPPSNLAVGWVDTTSVQIIWVPIPYTGDGGFYRVKYATSPGGPYTEAGTTADKSASKFTVTDLDPAITYYFVAETFTPANGNNQNDLTSPLSAEISATTLHEGEGGENLADAVHILQILAGNAEAAPNVTLDADFNNDGRLGLEDVIYILRVVSQTP